MTMDDARAVSLLWCGPTRVGIIYDSFCSDETWFGTFVLELRPGEGEQQDRIIGFIAFCRAWNRKALEQDADAAEFDDYRELTTSGPWRVTHANGVATRIEVAPNFYDDEVSWMEVANG